MPWTKHLEWVDLTDFTPGLFEEDRDVALDTLMMPPNAATIMEDCLPLAQGGLRAAFRVSKTLATTGITDVTKELVTGIGLHSSLTLRAGGGNAPDRYLTTLDTTAGRERIYRMDESNAEAVWKQGTSYSRTAGAVTSGAPSSIFPFLDIAGLLWMVVVLRSNNEPGFYKIAYVGGVGPPAGDGLITKINTWAGPAVANGARVVVGTTNHGPTLAWTTEGTLTAGTDTLDIAPYQKGRELRAIVGLEPSDLLIGREGAPWVDIAGDITRPSTPVREMGNAHTLGQEFQEPARTPDGIAFIEPGGRIYLTDGRQFTNISGQVAPFYRGTVTNVQGVGSMIFADRFLFCPRGLVLDWETKAWFKLSDAASSRWWTYDPEKRSVWFADGGYSFAMKEYRPFDTSQTARASSYRWQSAALARNDGRGAAVREVQIFLSASAVGSITVTRTNADGTTVARTLSISSTGKQMISFPFPRSESEYQQILVAASATSSSAEAPVIERIRYGMAPGHRRY